MKKLYKKPATNVVLLKVSHSLLTASAETVDYNSERHMVLSRDGGSFWEDEE